MEQRVTRQKLHALVWAEPMRTLAGRFGISDVAFRKECCRMHVPVPPRGHWARRAAGKATVEAALPPRPPGLSDETMVGGGRYWRYYSQALSQEEILEPLPPEPSFDEPIEEVRARVEAAIGRVTATRNLDGLHPVVARLLRQDDARREKQRELSYHWSLYDPLHDSPIQRRRLCLVSTVLLATARCGCKADTWGVAQSGQPVDQFVVHVHHQSVRLRVAVVEVRSRSGGRADAKAATHVASAPPLPRDAERSSQSRGLPTREAARTAGGRQALRVELAPADDGRSAVRVWQDGDWDEVVERHAREIAVAIVVRGEEQHRTGAVRSHRWRIERRAELIERIQQEREEAERRERERQAELERRRVERLLGEARALRQAREIRTYVEEVRAANGASAVPLPDAEVNAWAGWALAQADRIDPVRNGVYLKSVERPSGDEDGTLRP